MSWNYRVIHQTLTIPGSDQTEEYYAVHEVYYDEQGNISSWTGNPVSPSGETLEELVEDMENYSEALRGEW